VSKTIDPVCLSRRPETRSTRKRTPIISPPKVDLEDEKLNPDVQQRHSHHQLIRPSWVKLVIVCLKVECIYSQCFSLVISPGGIDGLSASSDMSSSSSVVRSINLMFRPSPLILFRPGDDPRLFTLPLKFCSLTRLRPHYTIYYL
jgi:hypothetical protein